MNDAAKERGMARAKRMLKRALNKKRSGRKRKAIMRLVDMGVVR